MGSSSLSWLYSNSYLAKDDASKQQKQRNKRLKRKRKEVVESESEDDDTENYMQSSVSIIGLKQEKQKKRDSIVEIQALPDGDAKGIKFHIQVNDTNKDD